MSESQTSTFMLQVRDSSHLLYVLMIGLRDERHSEALPARVDFSITFSTRWTMSRCSDFARYSVPETRETAQHLDIFAISFLCLICFFSASFLAHPESKNLTTHDNKYIWH